MSWLDLVKNNPELANSHEKLAAAMEQNKKAAAERVRLAPSLIDVATDANSALYDADIVQRRETRVINNVPQDLSHDLGASSKQTSSGSFQIHSALLTTVIVFAVSAFFLVTRRRIHAKKGRIIVGGSLLLGAVLCILWLHIGSAEYYKPDADVTPTHTPTVTASQHTKAPEPTPSPKSVQTKSYVLNTNTKKFHEPYCPSVEDIASGNRTDVESTAEKLKQRGYTPCKRCNPS